MKIIHPFSIKDIHFENNLMLAPMAQINDPIFRMLCRKEGAAYLCSELISAKGLIMQNKSSLELIKEIFDFEMPMGIQLFGADPEQMAQAAKITEENSKAAFIDINMGCPVRKVVKKGAGSALMKEPKLAEKIVKSIKKAVKIPVTVKIRLGWDETSINVHDFTKMLIDSGADMITVHARTRAQMYSGKARWELLEGLKDICGSTAFAANGDIKTVQDLKKVYEISGCDAFMIGRGAIGNPFIFSLILGKRKKITAMQKYKVIKKHFKAILMLYGAKGVGKFRVHSFGYIKGLRHATTSRKKLSLEFNPAAILNELKSIVMQSNFL